MIAARLLKLLALVSLAATAAAVVQWHQTGEAPQRILLHTSLGAFLAALLVGLIGEETRPRIMLRFLASLCALVSVLALVTDWTQSGDGFTSMAEHMRRLAPSVLGALKAAVLRSASQTGWDVVSGFLSIPTFLVFASLAVICGFASRPRERLSIFVN